MQCQAHWVNKYGWHCFCTNQADFKQDKSGPTTPMPTPTSIHYSKPLIWMQRCFYHTKQAIGRDGNP